LSDERPYNIDVKFTDSLTGEKKTFKMRRTKYLYDQSLQKQLVAPNGNLNVTELWFARIADAVEGKTIDELKKLDTFEMNIYITKWMQYNDVNPATFLEVHESETSKTTI
jgi:hypothetical protein